MTGRPVTDNKTLKIGQGKAGPGRPKGMLNKTNGILKDAILQAAQTAGGTDGIAGYLAKQAEANPGPFMALLGKVLPLQVEGTGPSGAITFTWQK